MAILVGGHEAAVRVVPDVAWREELSADVDDSGNDHPCTYEWRHPGDVVYVVLQHGNRGRGAAERGKPRRKGCGVTGLDGQHHEVDRGRLGRVHQTDGGAIDRCGCALDDKAVKWMPHAEGHRVAE